jgi:hypothetical protein
MSLLRSLIQHGARCGLFLLLAGCAAPDVNPPSARIGRGYVDLYTQPKDDVWWKVDVFDTRKEGYQEIAAEFKAPGQSILRLQARPGRYKARISFVNQGVEAPAEVEVEVREGMVTPVEVKLEKGGSSYVRVVQDRARSGFRTAGANRVTDYSQPLWQLSATAQPAVPYLPKQSTAYWK